MPMPGYYARLVERRILDSWSALRLPYGVRPSVMPYAEYTETVRLDAQSLAQIEQDLTHAGRLKPHDDRVLVLLSDSLPEITDRRGPAAQLGVRCRMKGMS